MIRTKGLTKDYGGGRGVFDLDLHVPKGRIFGYIGPNGSGKTTTIRLLCGLLRPTTGQAFINDIEVRSRNLREIRRLIGYMPDDFGVYDHMSVWEYLDFFCAAYRIPPKERKERIQQVFEWTEASDMRDYRVASLSRGMHQRIGLARTLLHDPEILILDEPASGLDPYARVQMRATICRLRDAGKTILLSSHILPELASVCDLVGIIENGRLVATGAVDEITHRHREHVVLTLSIDSDADRALTAALQFPAVGEAAVSGNELRLVFNGTRAQVADLNRFLVEHDVRVMELKEEETDLESAFLAVTGRAEAGPGKTGPGSGNPSPGNAAGTHRDS
ncbi:MAG: ABC transporter ATP-binding protein [Kiritimatiellaeota bacterium]|nr:ABC transporter ATP-binding protein [Kiritimatiellota bacterium]